MSCPAAYTRPRCERGGGRGPACCSPVRDVDVEVGWDEQRAVWLQAAAVPAGRECTLCVMCVREHARTGGVACELLGGGGNNPRLHKIALVLFSRNFIPAPPPSVAAQPDSRSPASTLARVACVFVRGLSFDPHPCARAHAPPACWPRYAMPPGAFHYWAGLRAAENR